MTAQSAMATALLAAAATVQLEIDALPKIEGASLAAMAPLQRAIASALPVFDAYVTELGTEIIETSYAGVVPGVLGVDLAPVLLEQVTVSAELAVLLNARARLRRISANLAKARG